MCISLYLEAYILATTTGKNFHPGVTADQAEGLCHRITLHFGRLNIETGALYYCICIRLKYWTVVCCVRVGSLKSLFCWQCVRNISF